MGDVHGPYDAGDWLLMKELRKSVALCRSIDPEKYRNAIQKETSILKEFFGKVA